MGVIKNDVGRPSNKTIMIRRILKSICLIIIIALAAFAGYYLKGNESKKNGSIIKDNKIDSNTDNKSYKEISLSNEEKIEINNKLNDSSKTPMSRHFEWLTPNKKYNFSNSKYKFSFLKDEGYNYGDVVTDTQTNKTYYKLSSVQQKSKEYFNEEIELTGDEEFWSKNEEYKDYIYIPSNEIVDNRISSFKIKKVSYNKNDNIYLLSFDILDYDFYTESFDNNLTNDELEINKIYENDSLNYDEKYIYATGTIKLQKINEKYFIKSFELKK